MAKIETVIFDWSGVLSDELDADVATVNEINERRGQAKISKERFLELYELPWENFYKKTGLAIQPERGNSVMD